MSPSEIVDMYWGQHKCAHSVCFDQPPLITVRKDSLELFDKINGVWLLDSDASKITILIYFTGSDAFIFEDYFNIWNDSYKLMSPAEKYKDLDKQSARLQHQGFNYLKNLRTVAGEKEKAIRLAPDEDDVPQQRLETKIRLFDWPYLNIITEVNTEKGNIFFHKAGGMTDKAHQGSIKIHADEQGKQCILFNDQKLYRFRDFTEKEIHNIEKLTAELKEKQCI